MNKKLITLLIYLIENTRLGSQEIGRMLESNLSKQEARIIFRKLYKRSLRFRNPEDPEDKMLD